MYILDSKEDAEVRKMLEEMLGFPIDEIPYSPDNDKETQAKITLAKKAKKMLEEKENRTLEGVLGFPIFKTPYVQECRNPFITIDGDCLCEDKYDDEVSLKDVIHRVYFAKPKTIVLWNDGTKTIVTAQKERFDEEKGILMALYKKLFGASYMADLSDVIENAKVVEKKKDKK